MNKRATFMTVALVILVGVGATLYLKRGSASKNILKPFEGLGTVAAQETAKLIAGQGQILLIVPDFGGMPNPAFDAQMTAFRNEIKRNSGISIAATDTIKIGLSEGTKSKTLRFIEPTSRTRAPAGPQPGQLGEMLRSYPQAKAILYFVDLPEFNSADVDALKQQGTKLVAISDWRPNYKSLFQANLLQLSIVPRWQPYPETGKKPRNMKDWFERSYEVVTVDNAGSVP